MTEKAFLVLESGETYEGVWRGGAEQAGEVVFNTSHSGYEEMATDPSYFNQILIPTAPMQGNYGVDRNVWESEKISINGFVCLEIQESKRDRSWLDLLLKNDVAVVTDLDTREVVLHLRSYGTVWGALVKAEERQLAIDKSKSLIASKKQEDKDWAYANSCREPFEIAGDVKTGPRVAVIDYGCKKNIFRELTQRCSQLKVFPSRATAQEIKAWAPDGILLSNGPGDPADVQVSVDTVKELLGYCQIFGICMGHHILCMALGGKTFKLKFGHRGGNHPIKDKLLDKVYVTSQNHGYAVVDDSLPKGVEVTHTNLNDQTVSGISYPEKSCFSVQFHPESHPGPHEAVGLFDYFIKQIQR